MLPQSNEARVIQHPGHLARKPRPAPGVLSLELPCSTPRRVSVPLRRVPGEEANSSLERARARALRLRQPAATKPAGVDRGFLFGVVLAASGAHPLVLAIQRCSPG